MYRKFCIYNNISLYHNQKIKKKNESFDYIFEYIFENTTAPFLVHKGHFEKRYDIIIT